jgi:hypothetical protein
MNFRKAGTLTARLPNMNADYLQNLNEGVHHEFFPEETEMVVVSFHTCEARELEEVACGSGAERLYLG